MKKDNGRKLTKADIAICTFTGTTFGVGMGIIGLMLAGAPTGLTLGLITGVGVTCDCLIETKYGGPDSCGSH